MRWVSQLTPRGAPASCSKLGLPKGRADKQQISLRRRVGHAWLGRRGCQGGRAPLSAAAHVSREEDVGLRGDVGLRCGTGARRARDGLCGDVNRIVGRWSRDRGGASQAAGAARAG